VGTRKGGKGPRSKLGRGENLLFKRKKEIGAAKDQDEINKMVSRSERGRRFGLPIQFSCETKACTGRRAKKKILNGRGGKAGTWKVARPKKDKSGGCPSRWGEKKNLLIQQNKEMLETTESKMVFL